MAARAGVLVAASRVLRPPPVCVLISCVNKVIPLDFQILFPPPSLWTYCSLPAVLCVLLCLCFQYENYVGSYIFYPCARSTTNMHNDRGAGSADPDSSSLRMKTPVPGSHARKLKTLAQSVGYPNKMRVLSCTRKRMHYAGRC